MTAPPTLAQYTVEQLFWLAHDGLPRQAPGSTATTALLLALAGPLAPHPRVLDVGCGTGAAALPLAAATAGRVLAVDLHRPFLDRLARIVTENGAGTGATDRVHPVRASMDRLPVAPGTVDLLWAEGSAYIIGFDAALAAWRPLLAPGGVLVLTEAGWTVAAPSAGAREFWDAGYPAIRDTAGNVAAAVAAGWTVRACYLLPDSDWDGYYDPLAANLAGLAERGADPAALAVLGEEIEIRRRYGAEYGYTGYVLQAVGGTA